LAASVQLDDAAPRPINTSNAVPRRGAKPARKTVSTPLDTSAFNPQSNDLQRLTPSKRKLVLLREEGDESFANCSPKSRVKTIDVEEAQESLQRGAARGDSRAIQKAIASGASVSTPNSRSMTPLMQCAAAQGVTTVKALRLLVEHGASVDLLDSNGWTALHHACRSGKTESVKYLLSVGADPTLVTGDQQKKTTLMLATVDDKLEAVDCLLKDHRLKNLLNVQDAYGWTALHYAMKVGSKDISKALLEHGVKRRVRSCDGQQPLLVACENGKLECVKLLVSKDQTTSVDVNAQDDQNRTPLMLACLNRHEDVANWLLRKAHKINKDATDSHGESALTIARAHGMQKVVAAVFKPKESADAGADAPKAE